MRRQKLMLTALAGMAFMLAPTLSTVGVTGADDLIAGKAAITQGVPLITAADRDMMSALDGQISTAIAAQR
jgi:hypothetical protein